MSVKEDTGARCTTAYSTFSGRPYAIAIHRRFGKGVYRFRDTKVGGTIVGEGQEKLLKSVLVFEHALLANRGAHQWLERRLQSCLGGLIPGAGAAEQLLTLARDPRSCAIVVDFLLTPAWYP